jgi:hypothetical protein
MDGANTPSEDEPMHPERTHRISIGASGVALFTVLSVALSLAWEHTARACGDEGPPEDPEPTMVRHGARWKTQVHVMRHQSELKGGGVTLAAVSVLTSDEAFARFLLEQGKAEGFIQVLKAGTATSTCRDVLAGRTLVRVEQTLARHLAAHYQAKTGKRVVVPDLMLDVGVGEGSCNP